MSIITIPSGLKIGKFTWGQLDYSITESSGVNGQVNQRSLGPPRWVVGLESTNILDPVSAGLWESMVLQLRGRLNFLAVYDVTRQAPQGSLGGSLTVFSNIAAGDTVLNIACSGQTSKTLLRGDNIQVGTGVGSSQLFKVMADAVAGASSIAVTVEPPARIAFASTTAVSITQPVAYFKRSTGQFKWTGVSGAPLMTGYAIDLVEQWS